MTIAYISNAIRRNIIQIKAFRKQFKFGIKFTSSRLSSFRICSVWVCRSAIGDAMRCWLISDDSAQNFFDDCQRLHSIPIDEPMTHNLIIGNINNQSIAAFQNTLLFRSFPTLLPANIDAIRIRNRHRLAPSPIHRLAYLFNYEIDHDVTACDCYFDWAPSTETMFIVENFCSINVHAACATATQWKPLLNRFCICMLNDRFSISEKSSFNSVKSFGVDGFPLSQSKLLESLSV